MPPWPADVLGVSMSPHKLRTVARAAVMRPAIWAGVKLSTGGPFLGGVVSVYAVRSCLAGFAMRVRHDLGQGAP